MEPYVSIRRHNTRRINNNNKFFGYLCVAPTSIYFNDTGRPTTSNDISHDLVPYLYLLFVPTRGPSVIVATGKYVDWPWLTALFYFFKSSIYIRGTGGHLSLKRDRFRCPGAGLGAVHCFPSSNGPASSSFTARQANSKTCPSWQSAVMSCRACSDTSVENSPTRFPRSPLAIC